MGCGSGVLLHSHSTGGISFGTITLRQSVLNFTQEASISSMTSTHLLDIGFTSGTTGGSYSGQSCPHSPSSSQSTSGSIGYPRMHRNGTWFSSFSTPLEEHPLLSLTTQSSSAKSNR